MNESENVALQQYESKQKNEESRPSEDKFTLLVELHDNTAIEVSIFLAEEDSAPVCICLPAMGVRAEYYGVLATKLADQGITAVTCDLRGHGKSSVRAGRHCNYGYNDILSTDIPGIIAAVKHRLHCKEVFILGHSLGGQLGLLFGVQSEDVKGTILIASGSNWYKNLPKLKARIGRYVGYHCIKALSKICGYFPGERFKFAGTEFKNVISDWLHESLTGRYKITGASLDYEQLLNTSKLPVLFISIDGDSYVTPNCSHYLASKLKSAQVDKVTLAPDEVGLNKPCHFRWVNHPERVAEHIRRWQERTFN